MNKTIKYVVALLMAACVLWIAISPTGRNLISRDSASSKASELVTDVTVPESDHSAVAGDEPSRRSAAGARSLANAEARDANFYLTRSDNPYSIREFKEGEASETTLPPAKRTKSSMLLTALDALSPQEARWLHERGYPKEADYVAFLQDQLSEAELARRAAQNDLAALAMLGSVQLRDGKVFPGYANLEEAAVRGSILALVELARYQAQHGDRLASYGLMQAALLRGDDSAMVLRNMPTAVWDGLSIHNKLTASTYALNYLNNIARSRARMGLPPLDNTIRPRRMRPPSNVNVPLGIYDYP
jgi:hypothetical protein